MILMVILLIQFGASEIHGGTILAMRGKDCVLIASDSRFSSYRTGSFLLGEYARPLFSVGSRTIVGCIGLDADAHSLREAVKQQLSSLEDITVEPSSVARVISNILYRNRMYVTPVVIGIDSKRGPVICCMDGLGALTETDRFVVCGSASAALYALCEREGVLYSGGDAASASSVSAGRGGPGSMMSEEELLNAAERALVLALQRDVLSGRQVHVLLLRTDGTHVRKTFQTDDV
jgi:20S proteasome subunit beta 3